MDKLRVFTNEEGRFGNPLGIVVDEEQKYSDGWRQLWAQASGMSEIVFIDKVAEGKISIYSPTRQIPFAGHAAVGTAYYFWEILKQQVDGFWSLGEKIEVWREKELFWVRVEIDRLPEWNLIHVENERELLGIDSQQKDQKHAFMWSWLDEKAGKVRARTLAPDWGIIEDEANGSGSMELAVQLERELIVYHGQGSVINTRPSVNGLVEVGGRVRGL